MQMQHIIAPAPLLPVSSMPHPSFQPATPQLHNKEYCKSPAAVNYLCPDVPPSSEKEISKAPPNRLEAP